MTMTNAYVPAAPRPDVLQTVLFRDGSAGRYAVGVDAGTDGLALRFFIWRRNGGMGTYRRVYVAPGESVQWVETV